MPASASSVSSSSSSSSSTENHTQKYPEENIIFASVMSCPVAFNQPIQIARSLSL